MITISTGSLDFSDNFKPSQCEKCPFNKYENHDDFCKLFELVEGVKWRSTDVSFVDRCPIIRID